MPIGIIAEDQPPHDTADDDVVEHAGKRRGDRLLFLIGFLFNGLPYLLKHYQV